MLLGCPARGGLPCNILERAGCPARGGLPFPLSLPQRSDVGASMRRSMAHTRDTEGHYQEDLFFLSQNGSSCFSLETAQAARWSGDPKSRGRVDNKHVARQGSPQALVWRKCQTYTKRSIQKNLPQSTFPHFLSIFLHTGLNLDQKVARKPRRGTPRSQTVPQRCPKGAQTKHQRPAGE